MDELTLALEVTLSSLFWLLAFVQRLNTERVGHVTVWMGWVGMDMKWNGLGWTL